MHPSVPAASVKELIALAKAQPGKLNMATSGNGSGGHLAGALFQSMAGMRMTTVPYKGGAPAYIDLMARAGRGHVHEPESRRCPMPGPGSSARIAMTSAKRSAAAPELPTVAEAAGLRGYEASLWYGIMLPAGTPREIVQVLNTEIVKGVQARDVREPLAGYAVEVIASTPEEFAATSGKRREKWAKVIRDANIRAI